MPLSEKQRAGVEAILTSPTITAAINKLGINPSTMYRWLNNPEFRAEIDRAQDAAYKHATRMLKRRTTTAVDRLATEMESMAPNKTRVDAAARLLLIAQKYVDQAELKAEIERLKAQLEESPFPPAVDVPPVPAQDPEDAPEEATGDEPDDASDSDVPPVPE